MVQQTITRYLKKHEKIEANSMTVVKEEVEIDWDEKENESTFNRTEKDNNLNKNDRKKIRSKRSSDLTKKKKSSDSKVQSYKNCPKCKKLCKIQSFDYHNFYCGKDRHLQCAHCPYTTKYKKCLIDHIPRKHPEGNDSSTTKIGSKGGTKKYCKKCDKIVVETQKITNCEKCFSKLLHRCSKCQKVFDTYGQAHYHWSTRCGVRGYYYCHSCDYKSVTRVKVAKHAKSVHLNLTTNLAIQWKSLFNDAQSKVSSLYQCSKCDKHMESARSIKVHMRLCKEMEKDKKFVTDSSISDPNRCSICEKKFEHVHQLNRHVKSCMKNQYSIRMKKDSDEEIIEVVEDQPPIKLISADEIRNNIKEMAVRYCQNCEEESEIEENYNAMNQNNRCPKCKITLKFKCKKCRKESNSKGGIIIHVTSVCFPEEEFKCKKCDFRAVSKVRVASHYRKMHNPISADCKKCGKKFKDIGYLKIHLTRCGVKSKFQCEHCPYKGKLKTYLRNHIFRKHMEPVIIDKSQSLKIASQRFSRTLIHLKACCFKCKNEQRLYDRLKICIKCKNKLHFECQTCEKSYAVDDEKACDHVKDYLETIKFECKRCGRGAISKTGLSQHKSRCGKSFPCRFCKYVSNVKGRTTIHEKHKHPDRM